MFATRRRIIVLVFVSLLLLSASPIALVAQESRPDTILLQALTPVNFMLVELKDVHTTQDGVTATLTVKNPALSLFLGYEINDADSVLTPVNFATQVWHTVELIPPHGVDLPLLPSEPTIQYTVTFTSTRQRVLITSYALSDLSLAFNGLITSLNALLVVNPVPPTEVAQALLLVPDGLVKLTQVANSLDCFLGDPPVLSDIDNCLQSVNDLLDNALFKELVRDIAQQLGRVITEESLEALLNRVGLLTNAADISAFILHLTFQNGSIANQYMLVPVTSSASLSAPWNPRLIAPKGETNQTQPLFQWELAGGADLYNLQVSTDSDYVSALVDVTLTGLEFAPPPVFDQNTTYYWRVRGTNTAGVSAWSEAQFVIRPSGSEASASSSQPLIALTDRDGDVFLMNADISGTATQITSDGGYELIGWTPDGRELWLIKNELLYSFSINNNSLDELNLPPDVRGFAFEPSGDSLVFLAENGDLIRYDIEQRSREILMNLHAEFSQIPDHGPEFEDTRSTGLNSLSPNGKLALVYLFQYTSYGPPPWEYYYAIANLDERTISVWSETHEFQSNSWAPDSASVISSDPGAFDPEPTGERVSWYSLDGALQDSAAFYCENNSGNWNVVPTHVDSLSWGGSMCGVLQVSWSPQQDVVGLRLQRPLWDSPSEPWASLLATMDSAGHDITVIAEIGLFGCCGYTGNWISGWSPNGSMLLLTDRLCAQCEIGRAHPVSVVFLQSKEVRYLEGFYNAAWQPLPAEAVTSPIPLPNTLSAGEQATVQVVRGDKLNVRSGPGISNLILERLENDTLVSILEGPQAGDGYQWWRIRTPAGTEGWAVDVADGIQTLIPIQAD